MYPCEVWYSGHRYRTVEHAYQAAKTRDDGLRRGIREADSPFLAKRMGHALDERSDWPAIKREVMADLLWQKFFLNRDLRARLLATGDRELIEGGVRDSYWGVDEVGYGHNYLGKLLMAIREVARIAVVNPNDGNARK